MKLQATIRAHLLQPYLDALLDKGIRADNLMRRHGLDQRNLENPWARVGLVPFIRFTEDAALALNDPFLGLRLGAGRTPESVGPLGMLIKTAPTLKAALDRFPLWSKGLQESSCIELIDGEHGADFCYRIFGVDPLESRQDIELTIASFTTLVRARLGQDWCPLEVHFEHPAPAQTALYERIFRAPVYFEQPISKFVIPRADLEHRCTRVDHAMASFVEFQLKILSEEVADQKQLAQKVGIVVARLLGHQSVTLQSVARELGLSVRTLQRHLLEEGVTFRDVVRTQRRRVAETLLSGHAPISVAAAAVSAGYSDGTTLSRAFKTWTGQAPSRYARRPSLGAGPA